MQTLQPFSSFLDMLAPRFLAKIATEASVAQLASQQLQMVTCSQMLLCAGCTEEPVWEAARV